MHYPINEIFQTIQGEGVFTGVPAIFVRLQGCPVGCPWCDTRHTWVVDPAREVGSREVLDPTFRTRFMNKSAGIEGRERR